MKLEQFQALAGKSNYIITNAKERGKDIYPLAQELADAEPSVLKHAPAMRKRKAEPLIGHLIEAMDRIIAEIDSKKKESEKPTKEKKSGGSDDAGGK